MKSPMVGVGERSFHVVYEHDKGYLIKGSC